MFKALIAIAVGMVVFGFFGTFKSLARDSVFPDISQSVVLLAQQGGARGTGFLVKGASGKIYLASVWHVCGKETELKAFREGEFEQVTAKVVAIDAGNDICILTSVPGKPLPLGKEPSMYDPVFSLGHPYGVTNAVDSHGRYNGKSYDTFIYPYSTDGCPKGMKVGITQDGPVCAQMVTLGNLSMPMHPGDSGSPIVDSQGNVVGIGQSYDRRTTLGFMTHVEGLRNLLKDL